jgi:DNA-binding response OmpR family regulator
MEELSREQLEEQVELLKQQLSALAGTSQELGVLMALRHGMTHRLATILYILVKRAPAVISRPAFHSIFYGDRADGGPEPKIIDVHISRLRSLLKRLNEKGLCPPDLKIDTVWHAGYRASPQLVKWVHELYAAQIPKEK